MSRTNTTQAASNERRRRYFVDPQVQGALLRQAIYYWLWASATFALIIFIYRVFPAWLSGADQETGGIWYHLAPYVVASAALFPIVVFSAIRFSNRFVGPMVRVRRTLKQLAQGEATSMGAFRENDFWSDAVDDINEIAALLRQLQPSASAAPNSQENVASYDDGTEASEGIAETQPIALA